ncbi:zona pellucida-binding protein 2 isoform X3 [Struthio camelus]|uniref:zona pellucida-binding protein 2 isoform X3 n=1 Tax=Struthio camelus TaxID=8801 RepID=UPI003603B255
MPEPLRFPAWGLLGLAAVVAPALAQERAVIEKEYSVDIFKKNHIYGNIRREVNVYVKMFTNSPFLVCMDLALSQEEVIDPNYLWIGPDGKNLEAYREPDYAYKITVRFTTKECKLVANDKFFEELKIILDNIISDLACHVIDPSYKCHSVKKPKHSLLYELFVTFQVNPFAPGWEEVCNQLPYDCEDATNMRVQEARDRIEEFFNKQAYALKHDFQTLPTIHYVDHSFEVIRIDSCRPGFGKNDITHNDCASCCVVCDPGTYSPNNEVTCRTCVRTEIKQYGAKSC